MIKNEVKAQPTVFLVDDDPGVREAIQFLVESVALAVETFTSADEFLAAYDPSRPGCLVLDIRMPGTSGLELQEQLLARQSKLPVIMITGHGDVPLCVRAFEGGAFAFVEKPIDHQVLLDHIHRAIRADAQRRQACAERPEIAAKIEQLTPREHEVMGLLVDGKTMKKIASELEISIQTCSKHRAKVLQKLGVENDVELVHLMLNSRRSSS